MFDLHRSSWKRPRLDTAETAMEQRKAAIRCSLADCSKHVEGIAYSLDLDRTQEALSRSTELRDDFFRLACLLYSESCKSDRALSRSDWNDSNKVFQAADPQLQETLSEFLQQLDAATNAMAEDPQASALDAGLTTARRVLRRARRVFLEMKRHELRTSLDVYKRKLTRTIVGVIVVVSLPTTAGYAIYRARLPRIKILEASYGANCNDRRNPANGRIYSVPPGNATRAAEQACEAAAAGCVVSVSGALFPDSAPMCGKAFRIVWECSGDPVPHAATIPGEALGRTVKLTCGHQPRITISRATYGGNCQGKPNPSGGVYGSMTGNLTDLVKHTCELAEGSCLLGPELGQIPDPAPFCGKDLEVVWNCSNEKQERSSRLEPEASGKRLTLACR